MDCFLVVGSEIRKRFKQMTKANKPFTMKRGEKALREKTFVRRLGNFIDKNWESFTPKEIDFLFNMGRDRKYIIMLERKRVMLIDRVLK
jgi:hypothetical protein